VLISRENSSERRGSQNDIPDSAFRVLHKKQTALKRLTWRSVQFTCPSVLPSNTTIIDLGAFGEWIFVTLFNSSFR